jgi:hypothetical protein
MDNRKYIGMDVHQASISIAVSDAAGKMLMECIIETKAATVLEVIQGMRGSLWITFEGRDQLRPVMSATTTSHCLICLCITSRMLLLCSMSSARCTTKPSFSATSLMPSTYTSTNSSANGITTKMRGGSFLPVAAFAIRAWSTSSSAAFRSLARPCTRCCRSAKSSSSTPISLAAAAGQEFIFDGQIYVENAFGHARRTGAVQLRDNITDYSIVRMPCSSVRSPGENHIGTQSLKLLGDALGQPVHQRAIACVVTEPAVWKTEQDGRLHAERLRGAPRFFSAHTHEFLIAWHCIPTRAGESGALSAIARNQQMYLDALARITSDYGRSWTLVICMSEHGDECSRPARLRKQCFLGENSRLPTTIMVEYTVVILCRDNPTIP